MGFLYRWLLTVKCYHGDIGHTKYADCNQTYFADSLCFWMVKHDIIFGHEIAYINNDYNDDSNDDGRYNIPKPIKYDVFDLKEDT